MEGDFEPGLSGGAAKFKLRYLPHAQSTYCLQYAVCFSGYVFFVWLCMPAFDSECQCVSVICLTLWWYTPASLFGGEYAALNTYIHVCIH